MWGFPRSQRLTEESGAAAGSPRQHEKVTPWAQRSREFLHHELPPSAHLTCFQWKKTSDGRRQGACSTGTHQGTAPSSLRVHRIESHCSLKAQLEREGRCYHTIVQIRRGRHREDVGLAQGPQPGRSSTQVSRPQPRASQPSLA